VWLDQQLQLLIDNIPSMKVQELGLEIDLDADDVNNKKQRILDAVKQNFSLRSLKLEAYNNNPPFNNVEKPASRSTPIEMIAMRNGPSSLPLFHQNCGQKLFLWHNKIAKQVCSKA